MAEVQETRVLPDVAGGGEARQTTQRKRTNQVDGHIFVQVTYLKNLLGIFQDSFIY